MRKTRFLIILAAMATVHAPILPARAQPALGRVLSSANVRSRRGCAIVKIGFNLPIRYIGYFPLESGSQLNIRLRPMEDGSAFQGRETIAVPQAQAAGIADVEYEGGRADGPMLSLSFDHTVYYHIAQGSDFLSILISVSDAAHRETCSPLLDDDIAAAAGAQPPPSAPPPLRGSDALMEPAPAQQKILDAARAAMTAKSYPTAIALLTKFLEGSDNAQMPTAQELLGVARERNGQQAHAKAEYEDYLRRYPDASGAGRVRQRLAAMLAHALHPNEPQTPGAEPPAIRWEANASISEYFYHDEMSVVVQDKSSQITIDNGLTTLQTQLVSGISATISATGEDFRARLRASASYTNDFLNSGNNRTRIGELYLEVSDARQRLSGRFGRQYRSSGGVLGRIDGGLVTVRIDERFKVDLVGGFPVDSSYSGFSSHRYAYGASADYVQGPFSGDIYALRQMDGAFLDRQSVGVDARYIESRVSAFAIFDYDLHFQEINVALLNGSMTFSDQTSINVAADFRRAPLLRTSDALIGQAVTALSDLLSTYTRAEIDQLALDRTATSTSLFASITHPLSDRFSAGLDATLWQMTGMPASGGVPIIPSTGNQYYLSGHLTGTSLLADGDLGMMSVGYAKMSGANRYTLDFNTRYPVMRTLRVGPRMFFSYRDISAWGSAGLTGSQIMARPTLRLNYRLRPDLEFDLDGGTEWRRDMLGTTTTQSWDYLVDFGIRLDL